MEQQIVRMESKTESLSRVESLVDEVCEEYDVAEDNYGNILIAVTEAVNNAIHHGNKMDASKNIDLSVGTNQHGILFTISDEGDGFDFDTLPDPTDPEHIENPHGRGIFLMRHLADEVEFSNDGRTVELTFKMALN